MRKGIFSEGKNKLIVMAICALLVVAMCLAVGFSSIGARAKDIEDAPAYTGLTNFTLEAESREDSMKRANEFNWKELAMEGFTLLENKESALPLGDDVVNVNLFGKNWSNPAFGGGFLIDVVHTGSGDADQFELRQHLDSFGPQGDLVGDDDVCVDTTLGYFTGRRFFVAGIISQLLDAGEVDSSQAVLI